MRAQPRPRRRRARTGASPWQVTRDAINSTVGPRSDLFSLGICIWERLTLKRLFSAPNEIYALDKVKHHVPEPPSSLLRHPLEGREELDRIVLKALAKNQDERYRSARLLTKDLEQFVGVSGAVATREDIAITMRRTFGERGTASIMEPQETRMSDDNKSGSDLDIFEGLGKKSTPRTAAAAPPPPPQSASAPNVVAAPAKPLADMKKTLMGIPGPAQAPSGGQLPVAPPASPPTSSSSAPAPAMNAASPSSAPSAGPPSGRISAPPPLPSSPPQSGSMRVASPSQSSAPAASPSRPPPPPGRGSLPNVANAANAVTQASPQASTSSQAPPPASTRPGPAAVLTADRSASSSSVPVVPPAPPTAPNGGAKLNMDWDDDDEATHVFDKESKDGQQADSAPAAGPESRRPEHASMDDILSKPRPSSQAPAAGTPPPPPAGVPSGSTTATLSGAFGALGQPRESSNGAAAAPSSPPSGQFRSGPPQSQSVRSAPPPPPGSLPPPPPGSLRPYNPSTSTAPMPPPPPPGQTTTAPMHMPPRQPSQPPMGGGVPGSMPPPQQHHLQPPHHSQPPQQHSQPPMPQMPPVSRAMEATAVVPRQQGSSAAMWVALLVGVCMAVGIGVYFLMPRTGTLVVNVADAKGGAVNKLEILVDGKKACESAPCIVRDVSAGVHEVKVSAVGFDAPAARAITIESRKDSSTDFSLSAAKTAGGTGLKVAGNTLQSGVHLLVDGKEIGPLPQELHDITPGSHTVRIVGSERYQPVEKSVEVKADELTDLGTVALKVLKGKATIQLGTPGAKVYLVNGTNRKEVPQFPIAIDFDPNEKWNLEAKMLGMEDYAQPISFDDGQAEKTITVTLNPKGSSAAALNTPPQPVMKAPVAPVTAPVIAAPKEPATPKEPAAPKEPATAAAPKEPKTPAPAAAAGEAFLNINSRPASTVLLDGKPLGPTPRVKVSVTPGTHTVLFVNAEESLKKSVSITIAAGETKAVSAKLRD